MRARARFLMLLMIFISFTGFSTTTDLNQNSNAVTFDSDIVGIDKVATIVVMDSDLNVNEMQSLDFVEVFTLELNDFILDVKLNETNSYFFSENVNFKSNQIILKPEGNFVKTLKGKILIDPLIQNKEDLKNKKTNVFVYRNARDGINCNLS
jgi:hypothetical protein